jgi:hypothetical protein
VSVGARGGSDPCAAPVVLLVAALAAVAAVAVAVVVAVAAVVGCGGAVDAAVTLSAVGVAALTKRPRTRGRASAMRLRGG